MPVLLLTGPAYATLNSWCSTPGWAAVTESLQRGEHPATDLKSTSIATVSTYNCVTLHGTRDPDILFERLSLAATVRKMLLPFTQRHKDDSSRHVHGNMNISGLGEQSLKDDDVKDALGQPRLLSVSEREHPGWREFHKLHMAHLMRSLGTGVRAMNYVPDGSSCANGDPPCDHRLASSSHLLHQLQAVALVTLVRATLWRIESERVLDNLQCAMSDWLGSVLTTVKQLLNQDLRHVGLTILGGSLHPSPLHSPLEISMLWERYAAVHFHGRLLPGCCNMECTNLEGSSEASLGTLLCGGCKGARYCSAGCQRAAWREGGHSSVCGGRAAAEGRCLQGKRFRELLVGSIGLVAVFIALRGTAARAADSSF